MFPITSEPLNNNFIFNLLNVRKLFLELLEVVFIDMAHVCSIVNLANVSRQFLHRPQTARAAYELLTVVQVT